MKNLYTLVNWTAQISRYTPYEPRWNAVYQTPELEGGGCHDSHAHSRLIQYVSWNWCFIRETWAKLTFSKDDCTVLSWDCGQWWTVAIPPNFEAFDYWPLLQVYSDSHLLEFRSTEMEIVLFTPLGKQVSFNIMAQQNFCHPQWLLYHLTMIM